MGKPSLPQLLMHRPHLHELPPLALPGGYTLHRCNRIFTDRERAGLAHVLQLSFPESVWSEARVEAAFLGDTTVRTTFYIQREDTIVATATARLDPAFPNSGYLHWVGVHLDHRGLRLGAQVSLVVLQEFVALSQNDAVLHTDDFRLPAIRTYLTLGFRPRWNHPSHEARWAAIRDAIPLKPESN